MGFQNSQSYSHQIRSDMISTQDNHFLINGEGLESEQIVFEVNSTVKIMI